MLLFNLQRPLQPSPPAELVTMREWRRVRRIPSTSPSAQAISVRQRGLQEYRHRKARSVKGGATITWMHRLVSQRVLQLATILLSIAVAAWGVLLRTHLPSQIDRWLRTSPPVLCPLLPFSLPLVLLAFQFCKSNFQHTISYILKSG